ncbi:ATP-dependent RNA helicase dbp7 [Toensbergia leucococca]|nr:ATP-dependent RNA helicase dbp7 [Toensbergia leucococca]
MADDGMLMNFAIGEESLGTKPIFKGGRWKDRLSAKKRLQYRQQKVAAAETSSGAVTGSNRVPIAANTVDFTDSTTIRPVKRQKLGESNKPHTRQSAAGGPSGIVSSLFSSNPSSTLPVDKQVEESTPAEPSNAPLVDGIDTFTSLGLSPLIATHLLTKLNLKAPTAIQKSTITQLIKEDSDAFIQAETGSGKTLAYLLPIVQRIMELSKKKPDDTHVEVDRQVHRDSGLFAIILAPTRELCKQISVVLDSLLGCAHWIVAGTVIGGEKKKSEKARLRKGLNILVATPGRLTDHLENTEVLNVERVRWLVLDEGDRLMELGFEEEIRGIVAKLEKHDSAVKVTRIPGLPARRTTVLCSATMKMTVQRLGEISLKDAVHLKAEPKISENGQPDSSGEAAFLAPAQLKQSYIIVPAKQRLVALTAFLKRTFARRGSVMKAIVFFSCTDSVDFHLEVFARKIDMSDVMSSDQITKSKPNGEKASLTDLATVSQSPILASSQNPHLTLHKLHGSLTQPIRTATLSAFTSCTDPSILLCTDVASRGLDLPNIDLVIEYDPPFSADDHLHRVGRTARAGREGRAVIFLMPGGEEGYIEVLKSGYRDGIGRGLVRNEAGEVLKRGFGDQTANGTFKTVGRDWEEKATDWQLDVERWVVEDKRAGEMARKAFVSHVRAYATHVAKERGMFDVKRLHLGHLAKAFALRERPGNMGRGNSGEKTARKGQAIQRRVISKGEGGDGGHDAIGERKSARAGLEAPTTDGQDAARRMRTKMREHMASANEFNIG